MWLARPGPLAIGANPVAGVVVIAPTAVLDPVGDLIAGGIDEHSTVLADGDGRRVRGCCRDQLRVLHRPHLRARRRLPSLAAATPPSSMSALETWSSWSPTPWPGPASGAPTQRHVPPGRAASPPYEPLFSRAQAAGLTTVNPAASLIKPRRARSRRRALDTHALLLKCWSSGCLGCSFRVLGRRCLGNLEVPRVTLEAVYRGGQQFMLLLEGREAIRRHHVHQIVQGSEEPAADLRGGVPARRISSKARWTKRPIPSRDQQAHRAGPITVDPVGDSASRQLSEPVVQPVDGLNGRGRVEEGAVRHRPLSHVDEHSEPVRHIFVKLALWPEGQGIDG